MSFWSKITGEKKSVGIDPVTLAQIRNAIAAAGSLDHYLYFPKRSNAEEAANRLRAKKWLVSVRMGADNKNWLTFAQQPAPFDLEDSRDELEAMAKELRGEYDGWEVSAPQDAPQ